MRLPVLLVALVGAGNADAGDLAPLEVARIVRLLGRLEVMKTAAFIRNGKSYDSQTAAAFLRKKWESHPAGVTNAATFVAEIATRSSTSGEPYRIRFQDGSETNCAAFLNYLLSGMDRAATNAAAGANGTPAIR